jgi:hypothetical protein
MRIAMLVLAMLPFTAFAQTFSVYGTAGRSPETWHGHVEVEALHLEYAHPISPRMEVGFVLTPMSVLQPRSWFGDDYGDGDERVRAFSASLLLRRHFNQDSNRVHFEVEAGTGPMWAEKAVPASTSRLNFLTQGGVSVVLMPNARTPLIAGYRFQHISNGGYSPRNPGLNVSALMLGLRWRR